MNNSSDPYEKLALIYDTIASSDKKDLKRMQERTEREIESLNILLKKRGINLSKSVVVDIGGGTGRIAFPLSLLSKKVILAEPSEQMLEKAKKNSLLIQHGDIEFRQEGFLDLSVPEEIADVVISFCDAFLYLHQIKEQIAALEKIKATLKPRGFILIDVTNHFSNIKRYEAPEPSFWQTNQFKISYYLSHEVLAFKGIWKIIENFSLENIETKEIEHFDAVHHLKMVSSTELILLFEKVGFNKIELYPGYNIREEDGNRIWIIAQKKDV